MPPRLAVVTATTNPARTARFWSTWKENAGEEFRLVVVWNGWNKSALPEDREALSMAYFRTQPLVERYPGLLFDTLLRYPGHLGTVPAFADGIWATLGMPEVELVACLHDDLAIYEKDWVRKLLDWWDHAGGLGRPLLMGFGGATGLGDLDIYQKPYHAIQLARRGFKSNMRDAELHGERVTHPQRVACLDGFSLIGPAEHMRQGFDLLDTKLRIVHHAYDAGIAAYTKRMNGEVWLLPFAVHHGGGMTAVADGNYQRWADGITGNPGDGDGALWLQAHKAVYDEFKDVLPIDVPPTPPLRTGKVSGHIVW